MYCKQLDYAEISPFNVKPRKDLISLRKWRKRRRMNGSNHPPPPPLPQGGYNLSLVPD